MTTTMPTGANGQQPETPQSVFITGAGGFIGRAIMARYLALGCDVRGMDLQPDPDANIVAGDITDPSGWADHAKGCDLFIHTAAIVSLAAQWPAYHKVTVEGTRKGGFSIEKAKRLLGYQPWVNFAEGMRQSEAWLKACGELEDKI